MLNLKKLFSKKKNEALLPQDTPVDLRRHPRLASYDLAKLTLEGQTEWSVYDLSYSGLGVILPQPQSETWPSQIGNLVKGHLTLLNKSYQATLTLRHVQNISEGLKVGFSFIHEDPSLLLALRNVLEPLRWGATLKALPKDITADRYKGEEWSAYRGEGPTDLIVKYSSNGALDEFLLLFRHGQDYLEVTYQHGRLKTSQGQRANLDEINYSASTQMMQTQNIDQSTLAMAIWLLTGIERGVCAHHEDITQALLRELTT